MASNLIQVRRGYSSDYQGVAINNRITTQKWAFNSSLEEGEIGYEIDTGKFKIGKLKLSEGVWIKTPWGELPYAGAGEVYPGSGVAIGYSNDQPDVVYSVLTTEDGNVTVTHKDITSLNPNATGTYYDIGLSDTLQNINNIYVTGSVTGENGIFNNLSVYNDLSVSGNVYVSGDTIQLDAATIVLTDLYVSNSGYFGNALTVGGTGVSLEGHQHPWSDINDLDGFCDDVATCINTELSAESGVQLVYDNSKINIVLNGEALGQHQINSNGIIARTGTAAYTSRTISGGSNIIVTDGNGVAGNPTIALSGDVSGLTSLIVDNIKIDDNYIINTNNGTVVIGSSANNVDISGSFYLNGAQVNSTATELNYLDVAAIGTAEASKALVLDANKEITGISKLYSTELYMNNKIVATQEYVDALKQGLDIKDSVRAILNLDSAQYSVVSNTLTSDNQELIPQADGVPLSAGNRVLVLGADESNGIYDVSSIGGNGTANWVLTRSSDANSSDKVTAGMFTFVTEGDEYGDTGWVLITNDTITLNSTPLSFSQFSAAGQVYDGSGLLKVGNTIHVGQGDGITVSNNAVAVDSTVVRTEDSQIIDGTKTFNSTIQGTITQANTIEIDNDSTTVGYLIRSQSLDGYKSPLVNANLKFDPVNNLLIGSSNTIPTVGLNYFIIDGGTP